MPTATRTFRVFVSSTFEDLKSERNALQRDVFPKLRKLCEENGARFQALTTITDSEIKRNPDGTEQVKFTIDFRVCAPDGYVLA